MSVLIKGMEMPPRGESIAIILQNGYAFEPDRDSGYIDHEAVEIKAPHGRLIDRDALLFDNSAAFHDIDGYTNVAWEAVDNAPTIIEAEDKDDG